MNGTLYSTFHAPHTSMRHAVGVVGVTVVRLANHFSPQRIVSYRRFGSTKSIVVEIGSPYTPSSLYGALLPEGACAAIRNPSGIGSKFFFFSWMLACDRHHHAWCTKGPCAGSISPMIPWSILQGSSALRCALRYRSLNLGNSGTGGSVSLDSMRIRPLPGLGT